MSSLRHISKQLYFHKKERNAILLIVIFLTTMFGIEFHLSEKRYKSQDEIISKISYTVKSNRKPEEQTKPVVNQKNKSEYKATKTKPKSIQAISFDPNRVSKQELLDMGLPYFGVLNLIKYREKGATFEVKKDLQKIYGLDTIFDKIEAYIMLPDTIAKAPKKHFAKSDFPKQKHKSYEYKPKVQNVLDINTATVEEFKELRGIGEILSNRIVEYRQNLGGFITVNQIGEVYYLPDSVFVENKKYFKIETDSIRKLKLNTIDFKSLNRHPLISYKQAQLILAYRNQHESFKQIEEIRNIKAFDHEFVDKILPYLSL